MRSWLWIIVLVLPESLWAQPAQTYVLGDRGASSWESGGNG